MNKRISIIGSITVIIILLGGSFLLFKNSRNTQISERVQTEEKKASVPQSTTLPTQQSTSSSEINSKNEQIINVEAGSFYYKPSEIKIKIG